jgi:hypothetical protein
MSVKVLDISYNFTKIYLMLEKISLYKIVGGRNRMGFPPRRGAVFGYTKARYGRKSGDYYDISHFSRKYPEIYEELKNIGNHYQFSFKSIQVNKNLVCPKHLDKKNVGESLLVSFGVYTGGEIIVNDIEYNAYEKPIIFNGSILEHYNKEFIGTKYSLVFFN